MYYTIRGLVLNSKVQGEYNKLITIYSYEWGKIQTVVQSAKRVAAKLSYATEPLTESEFFIFNNNRYVRPKIIGAHILENNTKIKTDFKRNLYALYAAEISDKLAPFNLVNVVKYNLMVRIWAILGVCMYPKRALSAFILRFLKLSGYGFLDYLKHGNAFIDKKIEQNIRKLSNCAGKDLDLLEEIEDDKVLNYVESYLTKYVRRPSLSIFLEEIDKNSK
ncbi:MAG: DNA repair protein RecO [Endomicrobium sp.]|jgi:DNA repair protein RecO (recombination protein O)|nr:DNA repair protein RecO [Endomicrobium sp.]